MDSVRNLMQLNQMVEAVLNNSASSLSRASLGMSSNTMDRFLKIEHAAGYPEEGNITITDYYRLWKRNALASRIVKSYPMACWKNKPSIYETEDVDTKTPFEQAWLDTDARCHINAAMASADSLCGIGRYGIILLGIDDGKELREPVEGFDADIFSESPGPAKAKHRVTYARAISERFCRIQKFVNDPSSARHGLPELYSVQLGEVIEGVTDDADQEVEYLDVHWTRVVR